MNEYWRLFSLHCHCRCCLSAHCIFSNFEMVTTCRRQKGVNMVCWSSYVEQLFRWQQNSSNLEQKLCNRIPIRFAAVVLWPSMNLNCFLKERFFYYGNESDPIFELFLDVVHLNLHGSPFYAISAACYQKFYFVKLLSSIYSRSTRISLRFNIPNQRNAMNLHLNA